MDDVTPIDGVLITPLKQIRHPLGDVYHGMKKSEEGYCGFGETYFSNVNSGEIKGWKKHLRMTLNLVVPVGKIRFVLFDDRNESQTKGNFIDLTLSTDNYHRLTIPPGIWLSFRGEGNPLNLLLNISNFEHDPLEMVRKNLNSIYYEW
jgi:dTDP-4-dehydrorhamnose 3,5-epimerase